MIFFCIMFQFTFSTTLFLMFFSHFTASQIIYANIISAKKKCGFINSFFWLKLHHIQLHLSPYWSELIYFRCGFYELYGMWLVNNISTSIFLNCEMGKLCHLVDMAWWLYETSAMPWKLECPSSHRNNWI